MKQLQDIVRPSMTRREARRALLDAGWSWVGGGSFAAVYGSPDGERVAKVTKPDRGADATYEVAKAHPDNPFLPTVFDRIPLANGGAVYEVERLLPVSGYDEHDELQADAAEGHLNAAYQEALDALNAEIGGGIAEDDHWRNVMKREDGTLVFTDYLADMNQLHNASVSAGEAEDGDFDGSRQGSLHWADGSGLVDDETLAAF